MIPFNVTVTLDASPALLAVLNALAAALGRGASLPLAGGAHAAGATHVAPSAPAGGSGQTSEPIRRRRRMSPAALAAAQTNAGKARAARAAARAIAQAPPPPSPPSPSQPAPPEAADPLIIPPPAAPPPVAPRPAAPPPPAPLEPAVVAPPPAVAAQPLRPAPAPVAPVPVARVAPAPVVKPPDLRIWADYEQIRSWAAMRYVTFEREDDLARVNKKRRDLGLPEFAFVTRANSRDVP